MTLPILSQHILAFIKDHEPAGVLSSDVERHFLLGDAEPAMKPLEKVGLIYFKKGTARPLTLGRWHAVKPATKQDRQWNNLQQQAEAGRFAPPPRKDAYADKLRRKVLGGQKS
jgi:hypothetical protein